MESTLSLQLSDFAAEIGHYLGNGRTPTGWSGWQPSAPYIASSADTDLGWIMVCVQSGLRQFYAPKLAGGREIAHHWSFLSPQRQLSIVAGQGVYDLPDDVYAINGDFTYSASGNIRQTVERVGIGQINRLLQARGNYQAAPYCCAVYPKPVDGVSGQRFAISFAPIPNGSYTLDYSCDVMPMALSAARPFPYGGELYGEAIQASMLAVAESRFNGEQNVCRKEYQELLEAAISTDARLFAPDRLGYVGDRSDKGPLPWMDRFDCRGEHVTYNGVLY